MFRTEPRLWPGRPVRHEGETAAELKKSGTRLAVLGPTDFYLSERANQVPGNHLLTAQNQPVISWFYRPNLTRPVRTWQPALCCFTSLLAAGNWGSSVRFFFFTCAQKQFRGSLNVSFIFLQSNSQFGFRLLQVKKLLWSVFTLIWTLGSLVYW